MIYDAFDHEEWAVGARLVGKIISLKQIGGTYYKAVERNRACYKNLHT